MPYLIRDFETKSTLDLTKVGAHRYAAHEDTKILCMGWCVDDGPIRIWHEGDPIPHEFKEAARNPDWFGVAHNAMFEMQIERCIMLPRYKVKPIPVERNICTMAAANAMALPAKLETCVKALKFEERKDKAGRRAMLQVTKPRRARKNEDEGETHWYDDDTRLGLVDQYCMQDVELERQLFNSLYMLSEEERQLWLLDQKINNRGFHIDRKLVEAAYKITETAFPALNNELIKLTGGAVQTVSEVAKMKEWLGVHCGLIVDDLDKETVEQLLGNAKDERTRQLLTIRQLGAHASVKKINAFMLRRGDDDRVRGEYRFHAAGTGRWASQGTNVQNLKRLPDDFKHEEIIKIILKGDYKLACKHFERPLETIGTLMRPMINAQPGYELWGADFSGIESRVVAWLANQEDKLEIFRQYDAGKGPDPYIVTAADMLRKDIKDITKQDRQLYGKPPELAFGFQGGINAFRKFATKDFTDEEIVAFRDTWRNKHAKIRNLWGSLNDAFWDCIKRPGMIYSVNTRVQLTLDKDSFVLPVIWLTLPSGRMLAYPDARARSAYPYEKHNGRGVYFKDNTQGQWRDVRMYGGLAAENVTQAVARDLLAAAMLKLDKAGFSIVSHTHDEVVVEERKGSNRFELFNKIMNSAPDWAEGLPIVAKAWRSLRYTK